MQENSSSIKRGKTLALKTKKRVFSENSGLNISSYYGEGFDFAEVREYQLGDDIRQINWPATAKGQKIYVNIYKQERELNVVTIFLQDGSMEFGVTTSKKEFAAQIGAILGYSALKNRDSFEYGFIKDDRLDYIRGSTIMSVDSMVREVMTTDMVGFKSRYEQLDKLLNSIKKKSLIFLIGDFFSIPKIKASSRRHEIVALIIRDRFEESPKALGNEVFRDLSTLQTIDGELNKKAISKYKKISLQKDSELFAELNKYSIRYKKIYSDQNPYIELSKLFMAR